MKTLILLQGKKKNKTEVQLLPWLGPWARVTSAHDRCPKGRNCISTGFCFIYTLNLAHTLWHGQNWAVRARPRIADSRDLHVSYHQSLRGSLLANKNFIYTIPVGASLVAQWLRIRLPMQGTRVQALVREDPTCRGATRPVSHNYGDCMSQILKPTCHIYWSPRA